MVFQHAYTSLDRRQTVAQAIHEILRFHQRGLSARERRRQVAELLDLVGLDSCSAASTPKVLSGGERQRVSIARALAAQPRVLVLDEPVASMDVSIQAQVLNLLADIRDATGVSYIWISHDLAVVRHVSDDVVVLLHGAKVEEGPTAAVFDHPQHDYTKRLRASVPGPGGAPPPPDDGTRTVLARRSVWGLAGPLVDRWQRCPTTPAGRIVRYGPRDDRPQPVESVAQLVTVAGAALAMSGLSSGVHRSCESRSAHRHARSHCRGVTLLA